MLRLTLSMIAIFILFDRGIEARAQDEPRPGNVQGGRQLALSKCGICHLVTANQDASMTIPNYAPTFFDIAARPQTSTESLRTFLFIPQRMSRMPHPELTSGEISDVSAYLLSLRSGR